MNSTRYEKPMRAMKEMGDPSPVDNFKDAGQHPVRHVNEGDAQVPTHRGPAGRQACWKTPDLISQSTTMTKRWLIERASGMLDSNWNGMALVTMPKQRWATMAPQRAARALSTGALLYETLEPRPRGDPS